MEGKHNKIHRIVTINILTLFAFRKTNLAQIREQMSGPDLHVFTLKFFALKKHFFSLFRCRKVKKKFAKKSIVQLFSADAIVKKRASKVAHNWSTHFFFTVQPRIDFS